LPEPQRRLDKESMKLLLVEDNARLTEFIRGKLLEQGHALETATTGEHGLALATAGAHDAIIVDRMLAGDLEGLSMIERLRASGNATPVLILSALADVEERIRGLKAGGDDYLTKPFSFDELIARLEVITRRGGASIAAGELGVADLRMDFRTHKVTRAGQAIALRPREFKLLGYLMRHAGQVVTRTMLLENVWGYDFDPETNVIDVQISKLRTKIDSGFDKPLLRTIRSVGFMLSADE
jgi:two-component system OmpR family response regulator